MNLLFAYQHSETNIRDSFDHPIPLSRGKVIQGNL